MKKLLLATMAMSTLSFGSSALAMGAMEMGNPHSEATRKERREAEMTCRTFFGFSDPVDVNNCVIRILSTD